MIAPFFCEEIMQHETCPVVLIETPNGPVRLNQSEFNPAVHTLYVEPEPEPEPEPEAALKVVEQNGAWFVVKNDGSLAENSAAVGYKKQADAEKALGLLLNA